MANTGLQRAVDIDAQPHKYPASRKITKPSKPSRKLTEEDLDHIVRLTHQGLSIQDIADIMDTTVSTISYWKTRNHDFKQRCETAMDIRRRTAAEDASVELQNHVLALLRDHRDPMLDEDGRQMFGTDGRPLFRTTLAPKDIAQLMNALSRQIGASKEQSAIKIDTVQGGLVIRTDSPIVADSNGGIVIDAQFETKDDEDRAGEGGDREDKVEENEEDEDWLK